MSESKQSKVNSSLTFQEYGKTNVRLFTVKRQPKEHIVHDLNVEVLLHGVNFTQAYTVGDNTTSIATDTMKNTVYVLAKQHKVESIEKFGVVICDHFINKYPQVDGVRVTLQELLWERVPTSPHSFVRVGPEVRKAEVKKERNDKKAVIVSGVDNLTVLKTTETGWEKFHRCEYTTLPEEKDRLLCTAIVGEWTYNKNYDQIDFNQVYKKVRECILHVFSSTYSPGVQKTIYEICNLVLEKVPEIQSVQLRLPNIHYLLSDLKQRFGIENDREVYMPTSAPSGLIIGKVERNRAKL